MDFDSPDSEEASPLPHPEPESSPAASHHPPASASTEVIDLSDDDGNEVVYNSQHRLQQRMEYLKFKIAEAKLNKQVSNAMSKGESVDCFSTKLI